jgi:SOS-response transcriptional repressor LexA
VFFTDRQLKVLGFVHSHTEAHGHAPTLKEIAVHFGFSKVTALGHLRALEKKQAIRRSRHQARSIELIDAPAPGSMSSTKLPITGELGAGDELSYVSRAEEVDLAALVPTEKNGHVLRIVGNSHSREGMHDGDLLIIEPRSSPASGEMILLAINRSRAVLGRYCGEPLPQVELFDGTRLTAEANHIRGIVRALIRVPSPLKRNQAPDD